MKRFILISIIGLVLFTACGKEQQPEREGVSEKITVFVSIEPQAYFVERVGGEWVEVHVLVKPGSSPATFEPTPRQIVKLGEADIYFTIGVPFEKGFIPKIKSTLKDLKIADISAGVELLPMAGEHHHGEPEGEYKEIGHANMDPHIWLDPIRVKVLCENICRELTVISPLHKEYFEANLKRFQADLDSVDRLIREKLAPFKGREFFIFHPSYGYFAQRYGLKQTALETGGKEPGAKYLEYLTEQARAKGIKSIFVQTEFSAKTAESAAEAIKGEIVRLHPLSRDYLNNLFDTADKIAGSFEDN